MGAAIVLALAAWWMGPGLLSGQQAAGQQVPRGSAVVTGQVLAEDSRAPMATAAVELWSTADSLVTASVLTDGQGRFRLDRMPEGTFFLRITSLGYGVVSTEPFEVAAAENRNVGELLLPVQALQMAPITVSAQRTIVTYEADRSSYNIGVMPGTEGASVTETLSMIPELEVDIDGRVTIRGEAVTIYINGREAPMSGEALAIFLEQFPADYLQTVEVLDNPGARYGAAGTGGIVDLVMKEGVELGFSGSVFANAGTRGQYGLGGRGTLQRGAWTVNGGGFLRLSDNENSGFDLRQNLRADPAFLRRDTRSDRSGLSNNLDLGLRYEPSSQSRFYVQGRASGSGNDAEGFTSTTHLDALESPILAFDRSRVSDSRNLSLDMATGFDYEWERRVHELSVELELERGTARQNSREEITEEDGFDDSELLPAELTIETEHDLETEVSFQVDYMRPLAENTGVEVGYDMEWSSTDEDRLIRLIDDPVGLPDGMLSNRGSREWETSHSVYTTLEQRFGSLSVQGGLRAEFTDLQFELPAGDRFGQDYLNFFPSANVSYRMEGDRQLRFSYSRRVNRPGLSVLNPINMSTDPLEVRVGNPDIEPQFTHRLSMNLNWPAGPGSLRLSPHYSTTRNGWAEITTVNDQGVSTRTYQNITSRESYGASLTYSLRQRGGWRGDVSVSGRQENRDASNLDDRYSGGSFLISSRANLNGNITDALSAQGNFSYQPPTQLPQGRRDARYRADLGLRYQMMDNRASVRLSLQDPFGLRRTSSNLSDVDYIIVGRSAESSRSAQISVSYALGGGGSFGRGGGRGGRR